MIRCGLNWSIFLAKYLETLLDGIIARSMNCCSISGEHLWIWSARYMGPIGNIGLHGSLTVRIFP